MIPRIAYRKVLKVVEHYRKQDDEDRDENPGGIPIGWGSSIRSGIERVFREEGIHRSRVDEVISYLIKNKILVDYCGDLSFPDRSLPDEREIIERTRATMRKMGL